MAYDPFYSSSPSDSGLLDGYQPLYPATGSPQGEESSNSVPKRDEYVAPEPGEIDAEAPEESLREVPLPEGYMARLRGFVSDL